MLTPRTNLARRITAALDASPSRIPVLVGGCGSGRTTLLRQLREVADEQAAARAARRAHSCSDGGIGASNPCASAAARASG